MTITKKEIPGSFKSLYEDLYNEISLLHARWKIYRTFYGTSEKRVEFLREAADHFFALLQHILLEDIQISISRLTDPMATGSNKNMTLELFIDLIEKNGDIDLANRLKDIYARIKNRVKVFRKRRNKAIAHRDLSTTSAGKGKLPGFSRKDIEDALIDIRQFINEIEKHYRDNTVLFEEILLPTGPDKLLHVLKAGLRYEELLKSGDIERGDMRKSKHKDA